jgi:hypothetical protein
MEDRNSSPKSEFSILYPPSSILNLVEVEESAEFK